MSPYPFPHFTIKEIYEQPTSLSRALNFGGRFASDSTVRLGGLELNKEWLLNIDNLVIAACGTSYYSALYGQKIFHILGPFSTVTVYDASELDINDFPKNIEKTGLLVISQSGETYDVIRCLDLADSLSIPTFSVVNVVGSVISRKTKCGVYANAGIEMAVASTKAFTSQVTCLCLIAVWFTQNKKKT